MWLDWALLYYDDSWSFSILVNEMLFPNQFFQRLSYVEKSTTVDILRKWLLSCYACYTLWCRKYIMMCLKGQLWVLLCSPLQQNHSVSVFRWLNAQKEKDETLRQLLWWLWRSWWSCLSLSILIKNVTCSSLVVLTFMVMYFIHMKSINICKNKHIYMYNIISAHHFAKS